MEKLWCIWAQWTFFLLKITGFDGIIWLSPLHFYHYSEVIMGVMAAQIISPTIVYSTVYSGANQRRQQCSASLALVTGEFPAQIAIDPENVSIGWRHHGFNYIQTRYEYFTWSAKFRLMHWWLTSYHFNRPQNVNVFKSLTRYSYKSHHWLWKFLKQ